MSATRKSFISTFDDYFFSGLGKIASFITFPWRWGTQEPDCGNMDINTGSSSMDCCTGSVCMVCNSIQCCCCRGPVVVLGSAATCAIGSTTALVYSTLGCVVAPLALAADAVNDHCCEEKEESTLITAQTRGSYVNDTKDQLTSADATEPEMKFTAFTT